MSICQLSVVKREPTDIDLPYYRAPYVAAMSRFFIKYATFRGRASRSEYWWWFLTMAIVEIALRCVDAAIIGSWTRPDIFAGADWLFGTVPRTLGSVFTIVTIVPGLAVTWRRLHDAGLSGAWYFFGLIPLIGTITLIVQTALRPVTYEYDSTIRVDNGPRDAVSDSGENRQQS